MQVLNHVPNLAQLLAFNPNTKAFLWDMDGTIMETEALHTLATLQILKKYHPTLKFSFNQIEEISYGESDPAILSHFHRRGLLSILDIPSFIQLKNQMIISILKEFDAKQIFLQEIRDLMDSIQQAGLKQMVVTSSEKTITYALLNFLGLDRLFCHILTREDTLENKPSPMPYLTAMEYLNCTNNEVIIFEDSPKGLAAAEASRAFFLQANWYNSAKEELRSPI